MAGSGGEYLYSPLADITRLRKELIMTRYVKGVLLCWALGLAVASAIFLIMIWSLSFQSEGSVEPDLRGIYTYPGIGALLVSLDAEGLPVRAPLTLAIFFSAKTSCPSCLSEIASYGRLLPVFRERGQLIVAVTSLEDSAEIATLLQWEEIPVVVSRVGKTLEEMGISHSFMPFKILFDYNLTAIYMRGADNTPESQADFEAFMLWLSEVVHEKTKE